MSTTIRTAGLALTGLAVGALALSACGSTPAANTQPPASTTSTTVPTTTITKTETKTEAPKTTTSTHSTTTSPSGGRTGSAGFDVPAFQQAMAGIGVPATGATSGQMTKGTGTMAYTMSGTGGAVGQITCTTKSQAGSDSQSDQDALILAKPFLVDCGSFGQQGSLKTQAADFVTATLPKLQGESMQTQVTGAVEAKVGRAGPGNYFVTIVDGG